MIVHGFALLLAAIGHDYRLPPPGGDQQLPSPHAAPHRHMHNAMSVLESFHAAELFKVLLCEDTNILQNLPAKDLRNFRSMVVKTILATGLAADFEYVGKFRGHVQTGHAFDVEESRVLLMALVMKVADESHPAPASSEASTTSGAPSSARSSTGRGTGR